MGDLFQQLAAVLYVLGWYESDGLRCQLCLFHPQHCSSDSFFGFVNTASFLCTAVSAVLFLFFVKPTERCLEEKDSGCWIASIRVAGACLTTLPCTTAVFWATNASLPVPALFQTFAAIPCGIGWTAV